MRTCLLISLLFNLTFKTSGQTNIEVNCLDIIKSVSSEQIFSKYTGTIIASADTVKFGINLIIIKNTDSALLAILRKGLVYPALIWGNKTQSNKPKLEVVADTLSISNLAEINSLNHEPNSRIFSFLLWEKGIANPSLYMLELTSTESNSEVPLQVFIEKAKLTAFGFCSILI